jgi:hypothetical protein
MFGGETEPGRITAYPEITPKMEFCPGRRPSGYFLF